MQALLADQSLDGRDLATLGLERPQARFDLGGQQPVALRGVPRVEGPAPPGEAAQQRLERCVGGLQEVAGQPVRRRAAEGVPIESGLLGGDPAQLARDADGSRTPLALELREPAPGVPRGARRNRGGTACPRPRTVSS